MNSSQNNDGIEDALTGPELDSFRENSLRVALTEIKSRRRVRRVLRASAGVVLAFAVSFAWHAAQLFPKPVVVVTPVPSHMNKIEEISNEELLALYKDHPVAIIGSPGHQTFVVLDDPKL